VTTEQLCERLEASARVEREAGAWVDINYDFTYVAIRRSDRREFFFQGEEATGLLDSVPHWINEEDYILATVSGW